MPKELSDDEMREALAGIIQENRDHPPENAAKMCAKCKKHIPWTITCKAYPERIPMEILGAYKPCKEFQEK